MLYIGTSGYYFSDWIGTVYPEGLPKSQLLKYYANVLNLNAVELNFTYYTLPTYKTIVSMLRKTPATFFFTVKLPSSATHEGWKTASLPEEDIDKTMMALQPMIAEGRLKMLLAQFPYSFRYCEENVEYLKKLSEKIEQPIAVELRHSSWDNENAYKFFKSHQICLVTVDEPQIKDLFPYRPVAISKISYFRFHGRNDKWFVSATERYNYEYSEQQLKDFAKDIVNLMEESENVFVFFNNCYRGKAMKNALMLRSIIESSLLRS
ncbi:MAG: DUF72 domain-containing protein [Pseudothermotoga sp.]